MEHEINMLRNTGSYQIEFKREGTEYNLSHHNELIFFRVFQEAISNIIKHADASTIWIHLNFQPSNFEMSISDNGAGFNYPELLKNERIGIGLRNMQNRAKMIDADFFVFSNPTQGTTISMSLDNTKMHKTYETRI